MLNLRTRAALRAKNTNEYLNMLDQPLPPQKPTVVDSHSYHTARQEVENIINNLGDVLPVIEQKDRLRIYEMLGPIEDSSAYTQVPDVITIDEISEQYRLVQFIRSTVLSPNNTIKHGATTRELTALTSSIANLSNMFFRQQDKVKLLQEVQAIKRAVNTALSSSPEEVRKAFISALEKARDSDDSTPDEPKEEVESE